MNALKANDNDSDLFIAIAKVFWTEQKVEKVKKWLENACTVCKDNGDAWAHRLRYEMEFGNSSSQQDVIEEFLAAEPRHGQAWSREAKRVENWRRDKVEILKKVAREIKMFEE